MSSQKIDACLDPHVLPENGGLLPKKISIYVLPFILLLVLLTVWTCLPILIDSSHNKDLLTPAPEETLQAYRVGPPIRNQLQAVTAAQAWLRFYPLLQYIPPITVVSAERLKYGEAKSRVADPVDDSYRSLSFDTNVWLVVFQGEFQIIPGESHGTPTPAGSGCVSVIVNPADGCILRWSAVGNCGQLVSFGAGKP
jgi:hypothetical protein